MTSLAQKEREAPPVPQVFHMTKAKRRDNASWPAWLNEAWHRNEDQIGALYPSRRSAASNCDLILRTSEGPLKIEYDDYIIRLPNGTLAVRGLE